MSLRAVHLVRASEPDMRSRDDERGPCSLSPCRLNGVIECCQIVHVGDVLHVPAISFEAGTSVVAA